MGLFSSIGDALFGSSKEPSIQKTSTLSKYQKPISKDLSEYLKGNIGKPVAPYTGETIAGLAPREQTAFQNIEDLIGTAQTPLTGDITSAYQQALSGQPSYDLSDERLEDYYRTNILNPLREEYQETLPFALEQVKGRLGGTPATSLSRTATDITEDYNQELAKQRANIMWKADQARADLAESAAERQLQAGQPALAFGQYQRQQPIADQQTMAQIGQVERALDQAQLDWNYKEFLRTQPENAPYINQALSYLGIPTQAVMGTQGQQQGGLFQDLMGSMISGSNLTLPGFGEGGMFSGGGSSTNTSPGDWTSPAGQTFNYR